jgi:hypothetical protein
MAYPSKITIFILLPPPQNYSVFLSEKQGERAGVSNSQFSGPVPKYLFTGNLGR